MSILTLYLDNSVIGGYFDAEFQQPTRLLWQMAEKGKCKFVASVVTQQEAIQAPPDIVKLFAKAFPNSSDLLPLSQRAEDLAQTYVKAGVVTSKYIDDARHVAIATTNGIGVLVNWNFRHLANYHRETGFNRINTENGSPQIRIISPQELVYEDD